MTTSNKNTTCPRCSNKFDIDNNRVYTIDQNVGWFYSAMTQFENFSMVQCPGCRNIFKASEARLFGYIKSPYAVVFLSIIFGLAILLTSYFLFIKDNIKHPDIEKLFLLFLSISLITSGALMIMREQAGPEEGFRGWSMIKGKAAVIIGVLTIIVGLILLVGSVII